MNRSVALAISMPQYFVSFSSVDLDLFDFVAGVSARDHQPCPHSPSGTPFRLTTMRFITWNPRAPALRVPTGPVPLVWASSAIFRLEPSSATMTNSSPTVRRTVATCDASPIASQSTRGLERRSYAACRSAGTRNTDATVPPLDSATRTATCRSLRSSRASPRSTQPNSSSLHRVGSMEFSKNDRSPAGIDLSRCH